ncbi:HIT family protein [Micromonospora zhanjiangensis]|uniref:HIT family protein n=1 Tax=Micromonospora zhanjiangensis TaxID=1522057 RepID=A0ABV8KRR7_9ACTN
MADCVFCAIVAGATPAFRVNLFQPEPRGAHAPPSTSAGDGPQGEVEKGSAVEEPEVVAFLDVRPVFKGHLLVVPREHVETLGDLPPSAVPGYFAAVRRLAVAVESGLGAGGTFVAMNNRVSQSVPHLHTHVVPRTKGDGLRGFFWPRHRYDSDAEAQTYADKIAAALS